MFVCSYVRMQICRYGIKYFKGEFYVKLHHNIFDFNGSSC